jgi:hypothetical protein
MTSAVGGAGAFYTEIGPFRKPEDRMDDELAIRAEGADVFAWSYGDDNYPHLTDLISKVRRVSYREFVREVGASVEWLRSQKLERCIVLVSPRKSNEWVAACARDLFNFKAPYCELGSDHARDFEPHLSSMPKHLIPRNIVLFDDACYSGTQMTGHVTTIVRRLEELGVEANIYVVVPFMTSVAERKLNTIPLTGRVHVLLSPHIIIPTVREVMPSESYAALCDLFPGQLEPDDDTGIGLTYFDHKIPNSSSFLLYGRPGADFMPKIKPPYT